MLIILFAKNLAMACEKIFTSVINTVYNSGIGEWNWYDHRDSGTI